jgi:hypothetical protein
LLFAIFIAFNFDEKRVLVNGENNHSKSIINFLKLSGVYQVKKFITILYDLSIERSTEFVIRVGAGTEAVGLFELIHLFVYKLMLQNAISGVKRRARLCLEQNGKHFTFSICCNIV